MTILGLISRTRSQGKPMRSRAPGAKFSTSTSQALTSRVRTSLPVSFLELSSMDRLLWLSMVKYRLSAPGTSTSCWRVASPAPGRSTLITSAPNQASSCVQVGPDWTCVKSRTLIPSNAFMAFPPSPAAPPPAYFLFVAALLGLRFPMRPLSVPAASSITALTRVGRPEAIAPRTARPSSSGVVALTPSPPKASIIRS